jgi:polar amino acid transport system permease protein
VTVDWRKPADKTDAEIQYLLRKKPVWTRRDVQRSFMIALLSSIAVFGVVAYALSRSEGWDSFRRAFLSWPDFKAAFPKVLDGFKLNVKIFLIAEPIILVTGLLVALARISRNPVFFPLRAAAIVFIDFFRGVPALLVIMTLGFGMPALRIDGIPNEPVFWGTVACILTSTAYTAETYRAGIETVHASQRAASRSLGLSNMQTLRYVVLPQAIRRVLPPLISGFVALQKETALITVIGPIEATRQAQIYSGLNFNFTSYVASAVLFIAITIPLARLTDYLLQRTARQRTVGGTV